MEPQLSQSAHNPLRVGMLGIGTVGSGTCRVLRRNRQLIGARAGRDIELRAVSTRTLARAAGVVDQDITLIDDPHHLVSRPDIDVVVEAIGGTTTARELVLKAIANGKHVVTANKALLALHGNEIFSAADAQGVCVAYEGAVAVSIPIVKALREGLAANWINWLVGIVNGTSNFILTRMRDTQCSFHDAVKEAQALGYAEADPTLDVGGIDAGHKLALLASLAFGMPLQFGDIAIEGIETVQPVDQQLAACLGYEIKSLAVARRHVEGVELGVHPALVPSASLMAHVNGSMNGILANSDAAGVTMHYGAGAGSEQTASAVIADLIDIARFDGTARSSAVPSLGLPRKALTPMAVIPADEVVTRHYLRVAQADSPAGFGFINSLERHGIGIESRVDTDQADGVGGRQVALISTPTSKGRLREIVRSAAPLHVVGFRVEDLPST